MNTYQELKNQILIRLLENPPRIKKCIDLLTEEQLWKRVNISSNSIANLILHLNGNIQQYIHSSLGGKHDNRQRDLEFSTKGGITGQELYNLINSTIIEATKIIEDTSEVELLKTRNVQGFSMTGIGNIVHVAEHLSYHTGQIALLTKLMVNTDLGFYADLDLNIKNG